MSFEQIITIATVCISGTCTVIAALITITSISKYKTQRAYDLFTSRRLKMYDGIQKAYQELMALSSSDYINMATAVSCDQFFADYELAATKLNGALSTTEKQEYYLLHEYDILHQRVKEYAISKTAEAERGLKEQRNKVHCFSDIYLWALWRYIQRLHKENDEDAYSASFDEQFQKTYENAIIMNPAVKEYFKEEPLKKLVNQKNQ